MSLMIIEDLGVNASRVPNLLGDGGVISVLWTVYYVHDLS
jgi:hypothetical protein